MPPIATHRSFCLLLSLLAVYAIGLGCRHTETGYEMTGERIAFIRDGLTTRAEVIETLGVPLHEFEAERTMVYGWETGGLRGGFNLFGRFHDIGQNPERWLLCVHLDQTNRVDRHGTTRQLETESGKEAALKWLEANAE